MIDINGKCTRDSKDHSPQEGHDIASGPPGVMVVCIYLDGPDDLGFPVNVPKGGMKYPLSLWPEEVKGMGSRCLIWTALRGCTSIDDENVEGDTGRGDDKDNRWNSDIDLPEIARECTSKEQQCSLQHQWQ